MKDIISLHITESLNQKSIRDVLLSFHLGKDKIHNLKMNKALLINELPATLESICHQGDCIKIIIDEEINVSPIGDQLEIAYEDNNYLIVNKPRNILIHSDGVSTDITLCNMVANYYKQKHLHRQVRFANRLDYETEGLVIFCKDFISEAYIDYKIEQREVLKKYYAVCNNRFSKSQGSIKFPIARDRHSNKMIVNSKGKEAHTAFSVIKNGKRSLVDITLLTGRRHQIRVHMAYINHPLIGDTLYGLAENEPLGLQAYQVSFFQPFINCEISAKIEMSFSLKREMEGKYGRE